MKDYFINNAVAIVGISILLIIIFLFMNSQSNENFKQTEQKGICEKRLLQLIADENKDNRDIYNPETAVVFPANANMYVASALGLNLKYRDAWVTLPLYRGRLPNGDDGYYIVTEASDPDISVMMGVNFSPRMANMGDGSGYQIVDIDKNGLMIFKGNIDFNHKRAVIPAVDNSFPPLVAKAGAYADNKWSSFVILPDGVILNVQMVHNKSGYHDRIRRIDVDKRKVDMVLLDGFQDGQPYFYHLVTDVSVEIAAALENGVVVPKLANIPSFSSTGDETKSACFAFSPVLNGPMTLGNEQGFMVSIANKGLDPINVFPYGPDNTNLTNSNWYSPMWDAHVSQWSDVAVKQGQVRRITSFDDLQSLIRNGIVTSAFINPPGPPNPTIFGLRATQAHINCPVICHPDASLIIM